MVKQDYSDVIVFLHFKLIIDLQKRRLAILVTTITGKNEMVYFVNCIGNVEDFRLTAYGRGGN